MIDLLRIFADAYRAPKAAGPPSPSPSPSPSLFDFIRLHAMMYEESRRIGDLVFDRMVGPAVPPSEGAAPREEELSDLLRRAQLLLLKHPVAAQAAFAALIAEGRRFAATPEGAEWAEALAGSDLVRRGRQVWDAVAMNMLEDDPGTVVPSAYLEALLRTARSSDLEGVLSRLERPKGEGASGEEASGEEASGEGAQKGGESDPAG